MNETSPQWDKDLLRRFEPIVRFSEGERFFPMDASVYVRHASLWVQYPGQEPALVMREGEVTLETLGSAAEDRSRALYFLKFVDPVSLAELATYRLEHRTRRFRAATGRLVRVGYLSRVVDGLFAISLLARGRVTGDTAVAAEYAYERIMAEDERYVYYGRVFHDSGWTILQYWFFYPFNNWRSGFHGANDHEGDWESISIYLWRDSAGEFRPEWVAYASHDYSGDDIRRHWDDPALEKEGEHPVVYAGAGSHASYYIPGEYLAELGLTFLSPLSRIKDTFARVRQGLLHEKGKKAGDGRKGFVISVPFVDYATGSGVSIGPGQDKTWEDPQLLNPAPQWVLHYRGLWGFYTGDPVSGEDAPAGPAYNRDGSVRQSWHDPLGWAGMHKEPLPPQLLKKQEQRRLELAEENKDLRSKAAAKRRQLQSLRLENLALQGHSHLRKVYLENQARMEGLSRDMEDIRRQMAQNDAVIQAMDMQAGHMEGGSKLPMRSHLRRPHLPTSEVEVRLSRLAEIWAAISIGSIMLASMVLFVLARERLFLGLLALIGAMVVVEAGFRRRLQQLIAGATTALAIFAALIVFYEFLQEIALVTVLLAGGYILFQNLRELWS